MTIDQALYAGRREAEKLMTTIVDVKRDTGEVTQDPITYEETPVYASVYSGKARIRLNSPHARDVQTPGQTLAVQSLILSLPIEGSGTVTTDDTVTVTANPTDTALVGTLYRITGTSAQSHATARRFEIERTS